MTNNSNSKIDVHVHFLPPSYKKLLEKHGITSPDNFPMPTWSIEQHLESMSALDISFSALSLSSPHLNFGNDDEARTSARKANEEGAELVKQYPQRLGLLASLPLPNVNYTLAEIEYALDVLKVAGFTLPTNALGVYLGNPTFDPIFQELNRRKTVVAIHPVKPASVPDKVNEVLPYPLLEFFCDTTRSVINLSLSGTIRKNPHIKFIIPHAGAFLPSIVDRIAAFVSTPLFAARKEGENLDVIRDLSGLYYDLAGVVVPKQLGVLLKVTDPNHLLYGSDLPFTPPFAVRELVKALDGTLEINQLIREGIYRKNVLSSFHWLT